MPLSDASKAFLERLEATFTAAADTGTAAEMRAYMRDQFHYVGLPSPTRRALHGEAAEGYHVGADVFDVARALFAYDHREYQYVACDLLRSVMRKKRRPAIDIDHAFEITERLVRMKSWWDTVDILVPAVAYPLILESGSLDLQQTALRWIEEEDFWMQRSAIILQLNAGADTDVDLLFRLILRRADSAEFFVRKGAGWALRQYSKVDPQTVRTFLDQYRDRLSPLTRREGGKYC